MRVLLVPQGGGEPPTAARMALTAAEAEALGGGGRVPLVGAALRLVKALPPVRQLGLADPAPGAPTVRQAGPSPGDRCLVLLTAGGAARSMARHQHLRSCACTQSDTVHCTWQTKPDDGCGPHLSSVTWQMSYVSSASAHSCCITAKVITSSHNVMMLVECTQSSPASLHCFHAKP